MQNNIPVRLRYSEVIRLFLGNSLLLEYPIKIQGEDESLLNVHQIYLAEGFLLPEMVVEAGELASDYSVLTLVRELAWLFFRAGDLYFDFRVKITSNTIVLIPLPSVY